MKRKKLNLTDLKVKSFLTSADPKRVAGGVEEPAQTGSGWFCTYLCSLFEAC